MRVSLEDGDDLQVLSFGSFQVILHVSLGIHHGRLTGIADQVRSVRQAFHVESLFKHKSPSFQVELRSRRPSPRSTGTQGLFSGVLILTNNRLFSNNQAACSA